MATKGRVIALFILQSLLLLVASMSIKKANPWDQLKMKQFCLPSTYTLEIRSEGCQPESVTVNACLGVCPSYVKVIWQEPFFKNYCQCCTATEFEAVEFTLKNCSPSAKRLVAVQSAKQCSCMNKSCN